MREAADMANAERAAIHLGDEAERTGCGMLTR
ncbi:hypothetical protein SAMN05444365_10750 [Micromonospora pattaloongensis]|uniref:Uncharacterized protein n=1 Tax=Micromonospora pattaloongensis TaxID=405436 RepID=A0A1H3R3W2_9ACTN|nr:hypothetical protein SAMN05444365_10750 [Micromonospora pattaloongensis]